MDEEKKETSAAAENGPGTPSGDFTAEPENNDGSNRTVPAREVAPRPENNDDFNRTVVIEKPALKRGREQTPLRKIVTPFIRKKQEIEDLIGGVDVSNYTGEVPDTSAELGTSLRALDSRYTVLEEFAQGGERHGLHRTG